MSGKPAARQGDMTQYGGSIVQGSAGVRIGAPTGVACSVCPGGVTSGHPVNPLLGAKVLPGETDIALPGPLPFILSRTYSSYRTKTPAPVGSLGPGWKMPADISPAKFHECFINWMRDCHSSNDKDVIAIDGKTLRHSYDKSRRRGAIHVISAFSTMHSLVIGQIKTDKKSNEITAIPELLNMLDIKGKIITTDAMGCQKDIAEKIQKQGGDYLFAVKGNQGRLNKAFEEKFPLKELNNPEHDSYAMSEKSHGREEIRLHIVCDVPDELIDFTFEWKGLKKLCVAVSFRSIIAEQKKEPEMTVRYYISSADLTAEKFATAIRNHWHVENKLHWRLDVVMNEDDCKIRRGNAAELFSGIRHIAINILTNDKVFKAGLRRKMRKAAMDRNYLASVLAGSGLS
ncbi:ISAs1 family transposase [Escherichia coli]|nr:ISAs1 family transposase [Escherichia coli]EFI6433092.1 ISAs1 family transposase [Escherichia coli]